MPSSVQLQLGAPLFLCALVIARAAWEAPHHVLGSEPPNLQDITGYVGHNCPANRTARQHRKARAMLLVNAAGRIFAGAGVPAPAGVCRSIDTPRHPDSMPSWLAWLYKVDAVDAVSLLAGNSKNVPESVYTAVESEFNRGIAASKRRKVPLPAGVTLLESGSLAKLIQGMHLHCTVPAITPSELPSAATSPAGRRSVPHQQEQGTFYYIAAGVGCGIREVEQVCTYDEHATTHTCMPDMHVVGRVRPCITRSVGVYHPSVFDSMHALQEGYACCGACEIDPYCQLVR